MAEHIPPLIFDILEKAIILAKGLDELDIMIAM